MENYESFEVGDYWTAYCELEDSFLELEKFVPLLKRHDDVITLRLASLASSIGNWVETIFYRMANYKGPQNYPELNEDIIYINHFREKFEPYYHLSKLEVEILPHNYGIIKPFEEFIKRKSPTWFGIYSKYKHNMEMLFNKMNLGLTIKALTGLFLLNAYPIEMRECIFNKEIIYSKYRHILKADDRLTLLEAFRSPLPMLDYNGIIGDVYAETELFRFKYPRIRKGGKPLHPNKL